MISARGAPTNPTNMECGKYLENGNVISLPSRVPLTKNIWSVTAEKIDEKHRAVASKRQFLVLSCYF